MRKRKTENIVLIKDRLAYTVGNEEDYLIILISIIRLRNLPR